MGKCHTVSFCHPRCYLKLNKVSEREKTRKIELAHQTLIQELLQTREPQNSVYYSARYSPNSCPSAELCGHNLVRPSNVDFFVITAERCLMRTPDGGDWPAAAGDTLITKAVRRTRPDPPRPSASSLYYIGYYTSRRSPRARRRRRNPSAVVLIA